MGSICGAWYDDVLVPLAGFVFGMLPATVQAAYTQQCGAAAVNRPIPSVSPMRMSTELRRKLGRGVHYNLRLWALPVARTAPQRAFRAASPHSLSRRARLRCV